MRTGSGTGCSTRWRPQSLARHVEDRFRGRVGRGWQDILDAVAAGAVPHHSFHVFAVYPWLGLMRTGVVDEPLRVLDQCRTTPAQVQAVDGDRAQVLAPLLTWSGRSLKLGPWAPRDGQLALPTGSPSRTV